MTDIIKAAAKKIEDTEYLDIFKVILFAPNRTKNREPLLYTLNGYEDLLVEIFISSPMRLMVKMLVCMVSLPMRETSL